jgi:hypothetical protein
VVQNSIFPRGWQQFHEGLRRRTHASIKANWPSIQFGLLQQFGLHFVLHLVVVKDQPLGQRVQRHTDTSDTISALWQCVNFISTCCSHCIHSHAEEDGEYFAVLRSGEKVPVAFGGDCHDCKVHEIDESPIWTESKFAISHRIVKMTHGRMGSLDAQTAVSSEKKETSPSSNPST